MKVISKLIAIIVVAAVAWLAWTQYFPNDEVRIRKMLAGLANTLSRTEKSSPVAVMFAADRVRDCLSPKLDFSIDVPGMGHAAFADREDLLQVLEGAWAKSKAFKVEFCDIVVTVNPDHESATSNLTVRAKQGGEQDFYLQEFRLELKKQEDKWRITRISPVEVFTR